MSYYDFEREFYNRINNLKANLVARPLILGGVTSSGGGVGGPPGGFIGYLPQTRVTYDLSELAILDVPISGASLIDNLNHIRYRIDTLENADSGHVIVFDEVELTQRAKLTFSGTGVTVIDNAITGSTDVVISGVSASGGGHTIQDEGSNLSQRTKLNFTGTGVTVTDDVINDATVVDISISGGANIAYTDVSNIFTESNSFKGVNIGIGSGTGSNNTSVGNTNLSNNTTGDYNVAIGKKAMQFNTIGGSNVAVGYGALNWGTENDNNIAIGLWALSNATNADSNVAIGNQVASNITTGINNIAIGDGANAGDTGEFNIGIGAGAFADLSSGDNNIAIGRYAGEELTTGNYNTFIGYGAGSNALQKVDAENSIAIGKDAYTTQSNQVVIGNASISELTLGNGEKITLSGTLFLVGDTTITNLGNVTITNPQEDDVLQFNGSTWVNAQVAISGGSGDVATDNIWSAAGDLAVGTGNNSASVLSVGISGYILTSLGNDVSWEAPAIGFSGAPSTAQFVTLATDSSLSNERVLTAGSGISITDSGAGNSVTISANLTVLDDTFLKLDASNSPVLGELTVKEDGVNAFKVESFTDVPVTSLLFPFDSDLEGWVKYNTYFLTWAENGWTHSRYTTEYFIWNSTTSRGGTYGCGEIYTGGGANPCPTAEWNVCYSTHKIVATGDTLTWYEKLSCPYGTVDVLGGFVYTDGTKRGTLWAGGTHDWTQRTVTVPAADNGKTIAYLVLGIRLEGPLESVYANYLYIDQVEYSHIASPKICLQVDTTSYETKIEQLFINCVDGVQPILLDSTTVNTNFNADMLDGYHSSDFATEGFANPMTTQGDLIYGGTAGAATRLAKGSATQVLTMNSGATAPEWKPVISGISVVDTSTINLSTAAQELSASVIASGIVITELSSGSVEEGKILLSDGLGGVEWGIPSSGLGSVATDTIWENKGDLAVGTGNNTATVLPIGPVGYILTANPNEVTGVEWISAANLGGGVITVGNSYIDQAGGDSDTYGILIGNIDDSNTDFTVSQGSYLSGTLTTFLNGQLQTQGVTPSGDWIESVPASGIFTFNTAPLVGDIVTVMYKTEDIGTAPDNAYYVVTSGNAVLSNEKVLTAGSGISLVTDISTITINSTSPGDVASDNIWAALGDLVVGTGNNTAAVLPVGTDGYALIADSNEPTGLKWALISSGGIGNKYIDQAGGDSDTYGDLTGDINDSNTDYTVSQNSYVSGTLVVFRNGQLQTQGITPSGDWVENVPASGIFSFNTAPQTGDVLTAIYDAEALNYAPTDAYYVVTSGNGTLSNERVLTAGSGISISENSSTITINSTATADIDILAVQVFS